MEPITEDDYFAKNPEFSTWLRERKKKFFNELTSDAARELFVGFIQLWNDRKLPAKYYEGMQGVTMRRTQHSWSVPGALRLRLNQLPRGGGGERQTNDIPTFFTLGVARASESDPLPV